MLALRVLGLSDTSRLKVVLVFTNSVLHEHASKDRQQPREIGLSAAVYTKRICNIIARTHIRDARHDSNLDSEGLGHPGFAGAGKSKDRYHNPCECIGSRINYRRVRSVAPSTRPERGHACGTARHFPPSRARGLYPRKGSPVQTFLTSPIVSLYFHRNIRHLLSSFRNYVTRDSIDGLAVRQ